MIVEDEFLGACLAFLLCGCLGMALIPGSVPRACGSLFLFFVISTPGTGVAPRQICGRDKLSLSLTWPVTSMNGVEMKCCVEVDGDCVNRICVVSRNIIRRFTASQMTEAFITGTILLDYFFPILWFYVKVFAD